MPNESLTPTLADVISAAIDSRLENVYTARPGSVVSFDASTCTAVVQPSVKRRYISETGTHIIAVQPPLPGIPVMFLGAGIQYAVTHPLEKGDTGLLITCECSLEKFKSSSGGTVDPKDDRRHSLADSVFIPGLRNRFAASRGAASRVQAETMTLHAPKVNLGGNTATSPIARKTDLDAIMAALNIASLALQAIVAPPPAAAAAVIAKQAVDAIRTALQGLNFPICSQFVESQ